MATDTSPNSFSEQTFPHYPDGDVLVVISPTRQYLLRSTTLRLSSAYLKGLLTEESAMHLDRSRKDAGDHVRYRLDLEGAGEVEGDETGQLKLIHMDPSDPEITPVYFSPQRDTFKEPSIHAYYDNVFRSFVYEPLQLPKTSDFGMLLEVVTGLLKVAEHLDSVSCVSSSLDVALIKYGQTLFQAIADDAIHWAYLGTRICSEAVVREAICHVVGQWHEEESRIRAKKIWCLDSNVGPVKQFHVEKLWDLVEQKSESLDAKKRAIEMRLMGYYPEQMIRDPNEPATQPNVGAGSRTIRGQGVSTKVVQHTKNIFSWMAVTLFRQFIGQQICADGTRSSKDGGCCFYASIHKGGEHYMDQESREAFTTYFPLSAKARTSFDSAVAHLKLGARKYVAELIPSNCSLDTRQHPVQWLTCTEVSVSEMPWHNDIVKIAAHERGTSAANNNGRIASNENTISKITEQQEQELETYNSNETNGARHKRKRPAAILSTNLYQAHEPGVSRKRHSAQFFDDLEIPTQEQGAKVWSPSMQGVLKYEIGDALAGRKSATTSKSANNTSSFGFNIDPDDGQMWEAEDEYGEE